MRESTTTVRLAKLIRQVEDTLDEATMTVVFDAWPFEAEQLEESRMALVRSLRGAVQSLNRSKGV